MLSGFQHAYPLPIRWADMDALGHVNNATYLTYLEQARIGFFHHLQLWDGQPDKLGLIMAKVVIEYKLPLTARDQITVYTRVSRMGTKSFDTEQWIVCEREGAPVAASAIITLVVFDYRLNQTAPIPDTWRASLAAHGIPAQE